MSDILNIMGVHFTVKEVECVSKEELRKGEINYLTNEISIDRTMPESLKEQLLMHEILHAVFDLLGYVQRASHRGHTEDGHKDESESQ